MATASFVEDDLRSQISDMLYSVQNAGGEGYIYCLIEHQSRPEKLMPQRLLRYSIAAIQQHLEQGHDRLPVMIPLLFYHGRTSPYPYTTRWLDCFADPQLAESVYMQAFTLVDITAMADDEILTQRRVALLELVQKHIRTRDVLEMVNDIARLAKRWPPSAAQFRSLVWYIVMQGESAAAEEFLQAMAEKTGDYQEEIMTIAQQLEEKGMQKGIQAWMQKGIQLGEKQGREKGRHEAKIETARRCLANGVERAMVKLLTDLTDEELDELISQ
ncbi:Rpn family recombination-promoting nuclease/putative transposase [Candidatus Sodalis endolongispinus]|uniref:Rpn family recombination-promoting nuclease/putative transposase n=1 Tax=Candidatus Sodalis endolongispinus TaxID=2812662 RepID=UPI0028B1CC50|nr:Rpn family recombination-promoting nuclease/putative transposase [Candidatus Sodalis endolongispinus]